VTPNPTVYDNTWINLTPNPSTLLPGTSLGGFRATSDEIDAPTSIPWLVFAVYQDANGGEVAYTGDDYIYRRGNPGFQGVAIGQRVGQVDNTVPEPSTLALVGAALFCIAAIRRQTTS
jgi:hypothetical protein